MAELRYRAGKIKNPGVHKIGIIALGSHLENHGPALPIDTDAKIGAHIAFQASLESGAKFLGIIFPAYELDEIDHGVHVSLDELKGNVIKTLNSAKKYLDIEKIVIVNSHGGNIPLMTELSQSTYRLLLFLSLPMDPIPPPDIQSVSDSILHSADHPYGK